MNTTTVEPRASYGWWQVLGEVPRIRDRRMVRVRCSGPKCGGIERDVELHQLHQGRSKACRKCCRVYAWQGHRR